MPIPLLPIFFATGASGLFAYWQRQKTLRKVEDTKQKQADVTFVKELPKKGDSEAIAAGLTPSKFDDIALILKRAMPYVLIFVGLYLFMQFYKDGKK